MRTVELIAVTGCLGSDQVLRAPGDRWACPADEAESLVAAGGAELADPEGEETSELTRISGIGPSTAAQLAEAGVETVEALAELSDDAVDALPLDPKIRGKVRSSWRQQAQALVEASS